MSYGFDYKNYIKCIYIKNNYIQYSINKYFLKFFMEKITSIFSERLSTVDELILKNKRYKLPEKYDWDFISKQYLEVFQNLTNYQNK